MNSKPFLLLLAAFLLTSSPLMSATASSIDDKKAEAAGTDVQGGCGHGGSYFIINHRGRIAQGLSCSNGCCSWGARKLCRRCCSSPEEFEALNNKNN